MEYYRINANELEEDELNYELSLRGHPTDGQLNTRQRTLRNLLRENEQYFVNVMQVCSQTISNDFALIPHRLREIEQKLRNGPAPECLSRLVHYHKRVRRYVSVSVMEHENKIELLELISNLANRYYRVDLNFLAGYVPVNRLTGTSNSAYQSWTDAAVGNQSTHTQGHLANETQINETTVPEEGSQPVDMNNLVNPFARSEPVVSVIPDKNPDLIDFDPRVELAMPTNPGAVASGPVVRSPEIFDQPRSSAVDPESRIWRPSAPPKPNSGLWNDANAAQPSFADNPANDVQTARSAPDQQVNSSNYVHISQIENYVQTCVSRVLSQLQQPQGRMLGQNDAVMGNLAQQLTNVNLQNHSTAYGSAERSALILNQPAPPLQLNSNGMSCPPAYRVRGDRIIERSVGPDARVSTPRLQPEVPLDSQFSPVVASNYPPRQERPAGINPMNMNCAQPHVSGSGGVFRTPRHDAGPQSSFGSGLPIRRLPHQQCNIIEKWPKFTGESNSVPVIDFLKQIEMLCRSYGIEKEDLRIHAHLLFRDDAYVWYTTYEERFNTWDTLVFYLKMRYDNPNRDRLLREEMRNRKQRPNERFSAFLTEMETLAKRMMKPMTESEKYDIIIENMKVSYKRRLALEPIHSLEHLAQLCYKFDALESTLYSPKGPVRPGTVNQLGVEEEEVVLLEEEPEFEEVLALRAKTNRPVPGQKTNLNRTMAEKPREGLESIPSSVLCWNCRRTGHLWRDCDKRKTIFCHVCGQADTTAFRCPNQHNLPIKEDIESKNE
ncbi:uncharacterized protein LOC134285137 [Aedes albopictus]|uniref:CCHC-type domain-containing protein n=1 Tax=Aedes albopictus TaxID=7160 RepID=A0ABM1ZTY1_AEDAL